MHVHDRRCGHGESPDVRARTQDRVTVRLCDGHRERLHLRHARFTLSATRCRIDLEIESDHSQRDSFT